MTCLLQSTIQYHAASPGSPRKAKCSSDIEAGKQNELQFPFFNIDCNYFASLLLPGILMFKLHTVRFRISMNPTIIILVRL